MLSKDHAACAHYRPPCTTRPPARRKELYPADAWPRSARSLFHLDGGFVLHPAAHPRLYGHSAHPACRAQRPLDHAHEYRHRRRHGRRVRQLSRREGRWHEGAGALRAGEVSQAHYELDGAAQHPRRLSAGPAAAADAADSLHARRRRAQDARGSACTMAAPFCACGTTSTTSGPPPCWW